MNIIQNNSEFVTCRSFCGFQSESKIITVSAVARLIPRPPARVERRKQKSSLPGALKCSIAWCRRSALVLPSSLWNWNPLNDKYSASISSILTIWRKERNKINIEGNQCLLHCLVFCINKRLAKCKVKEIVLRIAFMSKVNWFLI